MAVLFLDPAFEEQVRAEREERHQDRWDEVWDGVLVVPALPNNEHQRMVTAFVTAFVGAVDFSCDQVLPGANVSDRERDWKQNYRIPDVLVYLAGTQAQDRITHWLGGPDLAVEIASPGEDPHRKLEFYAAVHTRELLVVERDPWALELFHLAGGQLLSAGRAELANPGVLASCILPLTFRLRDGTPRPSVVATHTTPGQSWAS